MSPVVLPQEPLARFLRNGNHLRPARERAHFTAFLPKMEGGAISVYRVEDLSAAEVRHIGVTHVQGADSLLKGHAVLAAGEFFVHSLDLVPDGVPHPRHANVIGWATDARNRVIARDLAEVASLVRY